MRVAAVSNRNRPGYPDENLADHIRWVRRAASAGADVVLFPELSLSGYANDDFMRGLGTTLQGRWCEELCAVAASNGVHVAFGVPLLVDGRLHIAQVLVGPDGVVGHYEKVHLARPLGEDVLFTPGTEFRVFSVDGVRVGMNICYDGEHPGSMLTTAHLGAEVILHPYASPWRPDLGRTPIAWTRKKYSFLGTRALDTCTYVVACNQVGDSTGPQGQRYRFSGGALIVGPDGAEIDSSADATRRPHMLVADLDIDRLRRLRATSAFADRRADAYARGLGPVTTTPVTTTAG
jgi:predicted amidohydrolase